MNFDQLLDKHRQAAASESDKGSRFEKLMVNFIKTYQVYDRKFAHVWRWKDFPYRDQISGRDVGIDLAAETVDGEYWAIQCKCLQKNAYIAKQSVDSFFGPSGRTFKDAAGKTLKFANRVWISTNNNWSNEATAELKTQIIPCATLSLSDLQAARVDWDKLDQGLYGHQARLARKPL